MAVSAFLRRNLSQNTAGEEYLKATSTVDSCCKNTSIFHAFSAKLFEMNSKKTFQQFFTLSEQHKTNSDPMTSSKMN